MIVPSPSDLSRTTRSELQSSHPCITFEAAATWEQQKLVTLNQGVVATPVLNLWGLDYRAC